MTTELHKLLDHEEMIALVNWHMEQKQFDKALLIIKPLLDIEGITSGVYVLAGRLYAQLGLFSQAESLFKQYLEEHPNDDQVAFQLGMTQFDANKTEDAAATWNTILSSQPHNPPALFYNALAQLRLDNQEKAIINLQTILTQVHTDNLYFGKSKELISELERNPRFRGTANKINATENAFPSKDIYSIEH
ncbi:MAG: tetratricopeptide (TPR) repeat protein [Granulosicoccus sp.]|jgi:tetratricopeptide (TPR) repeat protein